MNSIAFIDTEIEPKSGKILDIGCVKGDGSTFHSGSIAEFTKFIKGTRFICGHNILNHDLKYISRALSYESLRSVHFIEFYFPLWKVTQ